MRKIISFMHISLDGFVAGLNGEMDWIKVDEEIFDHVGKRISDKVVLSRTMEDAGLTNTQIVNNNLSDRINAIKQQEGKDILLFGSPTAICQRSN